MSDKTIYRVIGQGDRDFQLVDESPLFVTLRPVRSGVEWTFDRAEVYPLPGGRVTEEPIVYVKTIDEQVFTTIFMVTGDDVEIVSALNGIMQDADVWTDARERFRVTCQELRHDGYTETSDARLSHALIPMRAVESDRIIHGGYCVDAVCGWQWDGSDSAEEVTAIFRHVHPFFAGL